MKLDLGKPVRGQVLGRVYAQVRYQVRDQVTWQDRAQVTLQVRERVMRRIGLVSRQVAERVREQSE